MVDINKYLNQNIKQQLKANVSTKKNKAETKAANTAKIADVKSTTKMTSTQVNAGITDGTMSASKAVSTLKSDLNAKVTTTKTANNKTVAKTSVGGKTIVINTNAKDVPITTSSTTIATAKTLDSNQLLKNTKENNETTSNVNQPHNNPNASGTRRTPNTGGNGDGGDDGDGGNGGDGTGGNDNGNGGNGGVPNPYGWNWQNGRNPYNPLTDNQPFHDFLNKNDHPIVTFGSTNVNLFGTLNTALGLFDTSLPNSFSGSSWDVTVGKYTWTDNTSGNSNDGYQVGFVWHPNQKDDKSSNADKLDDTFGLQPKNPDYNANSTSSTQNTDGSTTIQNPDGSTTTTYSDGKTVTTTVITTEDGKTVTTTVTTSADGKTIVYAETVKDGGSTTTKYTYEKHKDDGSIEVLYPNGSTVTTSADGKTQTTKDKDGNVTEIRTENPDGSYTITDRNGNQTTTGLHDDYGNTQTVYYDAKTGTTTTTTYTNDGTNGAPATINEVTDKNGNTQTSVTTTDLAGNTVTIWLDSNGVTHVDGDVNNNGTYSFEQDGDDIIVTYTPNTGGSGNNNNVNDTNYNNMVNELSQGGSGHNQAGFNGYGSSLHGGGGGYTNPYDPWGGTSSGYWFCGTYRSGNYPH